MATHSSVLAWRIPGMGEPVGLPSVYGVTQSRTRLKRLSSSNSSTIFLDSIYMSEVSQKEKYKYCILMHIVTIFDSMKLLSCTSGQIPWKTLLCQV